MPLEACRPAPPRWLSLSPRPRPSPADVAALGVEVGVGVVFRHAPQAVFLVPVDFQWPQYSVEVKATSHAGAVIHSIQNLEQLEDA
jgi:hypothetical protein